MSAPQSMDLPALRSPRPGSGDAQHDIVAQMLDVAEVTGRAADQALRIASRLLDGRQAAARRLNRSVALEMARGDAAHLTEGLRAQAMRILDLAESLDVELRPGLTSYRVSVGEAVDIAAPDETSRRELPAPAEPAVTHADTRRAGRRRRLLIGRSASLAQ